MNLTTQNSNNRNNNNIQLEKITGLSNMKLQGISFAKGHLIAYCRDGRVFGWGDNKYGQLG